MNILDKLAIYYIYLVVGYVALWLLSFLLGCSFNLVGAGGRAGCAYFPIPFLEQFLVLVQGSILFLVGPAGIVVFVLAVWSILHIIRLKPAGKENSRSYEVAQFISMLLMASILLFFFISNIG